MTTGTENEPEIRVWVLACNSAGAPALVEYVLSCTWKEYQNGEHYERAIELAEDQGYENPMQAFDGNDPAGLTILTARNLVKDMAGLITGQCGAEMRYSSDRDYDTQVKIPDKRYLSIMKKVDEYLNEIPSTVAIHDIDIKDMAIARHS